MWVLSFLGIVENAKAKGSAVGMLCVAGVALCSIVLYGKVKLSPASGAVAPLQLRQSVPVDA
eukprot:48440-Eustigmatos_ZCMA.PRE.1